MRPLLLEVEGFTCFTRRQVVDFSGLEIFAITGATGSGKSSLIDAMIWALFGQVPRMGRRNMGDLIAHGADRMWVRYTFEQAGTTHRVTRVLHRKRPAEARLERRLDDGPWAEEAIRIKAVTAAVEELLGLHYEAFVQAVVLPQGRFADFLHADPSARQKLLQRLLRLDIYDRMRAEARDRHKELLFDVKNLERRLKEDYLDATEENLGQCRARLDDLRAEQLRERTEADALDAELDAQEELLALWQRWDELQIERGAIEAQRPEVATIRRRLGRAREVAPFLDRLRDLERLEEEAEEARAEASEARRAEDEARRALEASPDPAEVELGLEEARSRRQRLELLTPLLGPLARHRSELRRLRADRDALRRVLGGEVSPPPADPDRLERLRALEAPARALDDLLRRREEEAEKREEAEGERVKQAEFLNAARRSEEEAAASAATARERLRACQANLKALERSHQAAHLRGALEPGAPCPVCHQEVADLPTGDASVDGAQRALEGAKEAARRAEEVLDAAAHAARRAEAARLRAEGDLRYWEVELQHRDDALATLARSIETALAEIAAGLGAPLDPSLPPEALHARLDRERQLQELAAREAALAEVGEELSTLEESLEGAPAPGELPGAVEAAQRRISELEELLDGLRRQRADLQATAEKHTLKRAAAEGRYEERSRAREEHRGALEHALAEAGYAGRESVAAQALTEDERADLSETIREFARRESTVDRDLTDIEQKLGERERVHTAAVDTMRQRLDALRKSLLDRAGEIAREQGELAHLERQLEKAEELRGELTRKREQRALYAELERELWADRFPRSELDASFQHLVRGASQRLEALSGGRYELAYSEGHFYVVDRDEAGERRLARTLSGGETFCASLALALELSEQAQQLHGAVRLDSLFVDEGFSSLDEDSLDAAAAVIEKLGEGRRTVGVITHVRAMSDRLPARLLLERGPDGSHLSVEMG